MNRSSISPKIKMCVVTTVAFTLRVFLLEQLVFLSKNGFDITIICNYDDELAKDCPKELHYEPIPIDRTTSIISTLLGCYHLYRVLRKNDFDMIQYCTPKAAFLASIASCLLGIKARLYCQWGVRYVGMQGLGRYIMKQIEKITCRLSTHISPDSYGNLDWAVSEGLYNKEKASVVHFGSANGVDLARFDITKSGEWREKVYNELGIEDSTVVFGWIGRVTRDKGVGELITAFCEVAKVDTGVHLIMVGPMEVSPGLSMEVLEHISNHPRIHYVGEQKIVETYYAAMDLFVVPSYREGFGSVALEAQAMGVPVIATDIPGPREAVLHNETGILVPPRDIQQLLRAMMKLKDDNQLRGKMGKRGLMFVREQFEQKEFWKRVLEHRVNLVHRM